MCINTQPWSSKGERHGRIRSFRGAQLASSLDRVFAEFLEELFELKRSLASASAGSLVTVFSLEVGIFVK